MEQKLRSEPGLREVGSEVHRIVETVRGLAEIDYEGTSYRYYKDHDNNEYLATIGFGTIKRDGLEIEGKFVTITRGPLNGSPVDTMWAVRAENDRGIPYFEEVAFNEEANTRRALKLSGELLSDFISVVEQGNSLFR